MADQIDSSSGLLSYVRDVSLRDDPVLRELREETADYPMGRVMQVQAEEGQFLGLLVKLIEARTVVEIGTFTGYSTLCMARALPVDGSLVTCDITERWPSIGRKFWDRAGVSDRIDLRIGDATKTLGELISEWGADSVDFVFIDADKANYRQYYEDALTLVRPGGMIAVDNTLFFGRVIDASAQDPDTVAVRELNAHLHDDDRVDISLLIVADGLTLVRKRDSVD